MRSGYVSPSIDIDETTFNANGTFGQSIIAPEKPGTYNLLLSMNFNAKNGEGYYLEQKQITVCATKKHDACSLIP